MSDIRNQVAIQGYLATGMEADLAYMLQLSHIYIGDINVFGRGKSLLRCWPVFHCHSIPNRCGSRIIVIVLFSFHSKLVWV